MEPLREYDEVRIARLLEADRYFSGTEGICRPPQVGDRATIVHLYRPDDPAAPVAVEKVDPSTGYTIWLADFLPEELEAWPRAWPSACRKA